MRICKNCGNKFVARTKRHVFCCVKCQRYFRNNDEQVKLLKKKCWQKYKENGKAKEYRIRNRGKYDNSERAKILTSIRRKKYRETGRDKEYSAKARIKYPERVKAGSLAYNKYKKVEICSMRKCNKLGHRHHPDYSKPLDIMWLCKKHHAIEHKLLREV